MNTIKKIIIVLIILVIFLLCIILVTTGKNKNTYEKLPTEIQEIQPKEVIEISKNDYNKFNFNNIKDDQKAVFILNNFKEKMLYNVEDAYKCLDAQYRELKFGNINQFKAYINTNRNNIQKMSLYEYQINNNNNYTTYFLKTEDNKEYILYETSVMEYTVQMDTYTKLLPDAIEKYNSFNEMQKVATNIDRFIRAINDKSYYYAYNCLADSFKNNYFKTQAEFEEYIRQNFYSNNKVEYKNFETQGELYTYSVVITDTETGNSKQKTFIMQLKENTDFALSFNI